MRAIKVVIGAGSLALVALAAGHAHAADTAAVQAIRDALIIDVPMELGAVEQGTGTGTLWVKGQKPTESTFARFAVHPVQAAVIEGNNGPLKGVTLWRAFPGGVIGGMRSGQLDLVRAPRYFCNAAEDARPAGCLVDANSDGKFEAAADAMPERGNKAYHLTVMKAARPLATPLAYRILPAAERPGITIDLINCDRDHDRPRFAARSLADVRNEGGPIAFGWFQKDSTLASCRRAGRLATLPADAAATVSLPAGGFIAHIGPYAFTVGEKKNPVFALAGPVDVQTLYRIEGGSLVELSAGFTPAQAQVVALKKFPYPMLMAQDGVTFADGTLQTGGTVASVPFRHAYRGRLSQDVTISTLFGKRSMAAGTMVYGFPAKSTLSVTRGGIPISPSLGDEDFRRVDLDLTWCAPMHREPSPKDKPDPVGRNGWSAACLPYSAMGSYTILTDRQPAFAISGLSYDAATSSNNGPPPVERDDDKGFEQPLRLDYIYERRDGEFLVLSEQVRFGSELTSSSVVRIYAPEGKALVEIAGAPIILAARATDGIAVKAVSSAIAGSDPRLKWDQSAWMRKQVEALGYRVVEGGASTPGQTTAP